MAGDNGRNGDIRNWIINALFTAALFFLGYVINDLKSGISDLRSSVNDLGIQLQANNRAIADTQLETAKLETRLDYIEGVARNRRAVVLVKK